MVDEPDTVTEALDLLSAAGYSVDFNLDADAAICSRCGATHELEQNVVERQFRFEGDSDPGDESIVLGIRCESCGARGVLVSAYGPDADADLLAHLDQPAT